MRKRKNYKSYTALSIRQNSKERLRRKIMKRISQKGKFFYPEKILHRAKVLALVIKKKVTQSQATRELELESTKQIRRLLKKYCKGKLFPELSNSC